MAVHLAPATRLSVVIAISATFFVGEISVGFYTHSLALVADAFHYMNDLVGFVVALVALRISQREKSPDALSFGWQRAKLLGAFFNGVFLVALGVSVFLQSIERFITLQRVENPMLVLIMGCVGLTLNTVSVLFLHEHDHSPEQLSEEQSQNSELTELGDDTHYDHRHKTSPTQKHKGHSHSHDLGMMGVIIHLIGDAINNIGVIIAAAVIWKATYGGRFYADPAVSMGISFMILLSALPLVKNSGSILLESVPLGVKLQDIRHDLEKVPGVLSIHELHVWRLSQHKSLASAHVLTTSDSLSRFMGQAKLIGECLHAYGIHSVTLQPELVGGDARDSLDGMGVSTAVEGEEGVGEVGRRHGENDCRIVCGEVCEVLTCCG